MRVTTKWLNLDNPVCNAGYAIKLAQNPNGVQLSFLINYKIDLLS